MNWESSFINGPEGSTKFLISTFWMKTQYTATKISLPTYDFYDQNSKIWSTKTWDIVINYTINQNKFRLFPCQVGWRNESTVKVFEKTLSLTLWDRNIYHRHNTNVFHSMLLLGVHSIWKYIAKVLQLDINRQLVDYTIFVCEE